MNMTNFLIMNGDGDEIPADAFGERLAFCCQKCGHPVLMSFADNEKGSEEKYPADCRGCGKRYFLDVRPHAEKLYIHDLDYFV